MDSIRQTYYKNFLNRKRLRSIQTIITAKCKMWANAFTTRQRDAEYDSNKNGVIQVVSRNPRELATELCIASEENSVLKQLYTGNGMPTCSSLTQSPRKSRKSGKRNKKEKNVKNKNKRKTKNKKKGGKLKEDDDDRISGSSAYLSDIDPNRVTTSRHHPWQCSLRFQGFRGRHRCGVTLLSGPTEDHPSDPFVLVGAAHCNYICKDKQTGYTLETCCCRPESVAGSCRRNNPLSPGSPFCSENPNDAEFTLAEPEDLVIVCGEFDSEVELIWWSLEPEEVFEIEEIINHPRYKPNKVNDWRN